MKQITLTLLVLIGILSTANAQIVNIPDANFKAALIAHNPVIDTNSDGEIQVSEAVAFSATISVNSKNISDLTGIEEFVNITGLDCNDNQLSSLDLSTNISLTNLHCNSNQLTSLNLSSNTSLDHLECRSNSITNLDITNNLSLTVLSYSYNNLPNLDVSAHTALKDLFCYYTQTTNLDLSSNIALVNLGCTDNQLTSLDLSANTNLDYVWCNRNQLTSLNISDCAAITYFDCSYNQLANIDFSTNINIENLKVNSNLLTSLDLSNNLALFSLSCGDNQLTSLDLSINSALYQLGCNDNQLSSLDIRNGNNSNMYTIYAENNPNLTCIQVDNIFYSTNNWTNIDAWASFGENCLYGITYPNIISGSVVKDDNCIIDANPQGLENIIVRTEPIHFYGISDSLGAYTISTDTGTYQVKQIITNPLITPLCPMPNYHTVVFDTLALDTTDINFFNEILECPLLTVDLNSDRRRRCFTNNTYVEYCNDGFANASGVEVTVQLPEYVVFVSADYPSTIDANGNYIFDIGDLAMGECGNIHIIDSVACIADITGLTQCTHAWITPPNDCLNNLDTASYEAWDKSSVMVTGECNNDTLVSFTITNTGDFGDGDMEAPQEYRIFSDNALVITSTFQINGGESITIDYPANGQTIRLEADQHPMHPGSSHPQETIEACGDNAGVVSTGFVNSMPMNDIDVDVEIDCMEIIDSYDPNDKSVSPQGVSYQNYLAAGTVLDYKIRFQNTGSDTAYTVVVVDTLSTHLNPSTIQWGVSSHTYTVDVTGMGTPVLRFTFDNINLPDSTTNELGSNGFVKFKVAPYNTLENGTVINNTAHIYFDYNTAITTNTTQLTISDTVLVGTPLSVKTPTAITEFDIYPNPTTGNVQLTINNEQLGSRIEIININGVVVKQLVINKEKLTIDLSAEAKGIYFVKLIGEGFVSTQKVVLE